MHNNLSYSRKEIKSLKSIFLAGSSNSQDSFPNQTGANTSIDGYPGYTGPGGYPPPPGGPGPDYNAVPQRPPSQTNSQTHPGKSR